MEQNLQKDILWSQRMQKLAVPLWIAYVIALIAALIIDKTWLLPLIFFVAVTTMYVSHREYRIMRRVSPRDDVLRLLKLKLTFDWIGAILLLTFFTTLLTYESIGLMIGGVFAAWNLIGSRRDRWIAQKIATYDPDMSTYDQVIERMKP